MKREKLKEKNEKRKKLRIVNFLLFYLIPFLF